MTFFDFIFAAVITVITARDPTMKPCPQPSRTRLLVSCGRLGLALDEEAIGAIWSNPLSQRRKIYRELDDRFSIGAFIYEFTEVDPSLSTPWL